MKKQIAMMLCALALMSAATLPALAAAEQYFPISVEEYTGPLDELRISKVYQLSLADDPSGIPTEDGYTGTLILDHTTVKVEVKGYEQTHDAQTVAKCFQVSTSTVYRLSGQMKKTGSVALQTSQRGRKPALTEEDLQDIDQLIIAQPDITIDEIIEKQGLSVSNETVRKAVIKLGYVYKKKSFYAAERERVRCCGSERSPE